MKDWQKIPNIKDLRSGTGKVVMVKEKTIAIFNIDGNYVAMDNRCPHRGGSLGDGEVNGSIVTCPWHGWQFHCIKGIAVGNENVVVRNYPLKKRSGGLLVNIA